MIGRGAQVRNCPPFAVAPAGREKRAPWMVVGSDGGNALVCDDGLRVIFDSLYEVSAACAEANQLARAQPRRAHR